MAMRTETWSLEGFSGSDLTGAVTGGGDRRRQMEEGGDGGCWWCFDLCRRFAWTGSADTGLRRNQSKVSRPPLKKDVYHHIPPFLAALRRDPRRIQLRSVPVPMPSRALCLRCKHDPRRIGLVEPLLVPAPEEKRSQNDGAGDKQKQKQGCEKRDAGCVSDCSNQGQRRDVQIEVARVFEAAGVVRGRRGGGGGHMG